MDDGVGVYVGFFEEHRLRDVYPSTAHSDSRSVFIFLYGMRD
jgi:hypothetical protein